MAADRYVALLRAVNVGGRKLPMADLRAMFTVAGCPQVETYIQSGNAVFEAPPPLHKIIGPQIETAIQTQFGYSSPVIIRSAAEMQAVTVSNPFLVPGVDEKELHVGFLADAPTEAAIANLDPNRSPPDAFAVVGQEIYFHFPKGVGQTKLTVAYIDSKLKTICTIRNWRTVLTLRDMAIS